MRHLALAWLITLGGCAMAHTSEAVKPAGGEDSCRNEELNQFVGQKANAALGAKMLEVSGARTLRWVAPGMAVTMDFRADRLTVSYDEFYVITRTSCG